MPSLRPFLLASAFGASVLGCVPDFPEDESRITGRRIIAVQTTPAEASPGTTVDVSAVVAARGEADAGDVLWTLCLDRKPLSELGPVSTRCLASPAPDPDIALSLGRGASVPATLPVLACQLFGPERPDPEPGQPAGRPADPDQTGGFYQPVLAWLDGTVVLGGVRIRCPLPNLAPQTSVEFNQRYRVNENPAIERLELVASDGSAEALALDGTPNRVESARSITLRATWPACPSEPVCDDGICSSGETELACPTDCTEPRGCAGAESYVVVDPATRRLVSSREVLVVSWYSTAGSFEFESTDADPSAPTATRNRWTAPTTGSATIWAVIRDARGGVSAQSLNFAPN